MGKLNRKKIHLFLISIVFYLISLSYFNTQLQPPVTCKHYSKIVIFDVTVFWEAFYTFTAEAESVHFNRLLACFGAEQET